MVECVVGSICNSDQEDDLHAWDVINDRPQLNSTTPGDQ